MELQEIKQTLIDRLQVYKDHPIETPVAIIDISTAQTEEELLMAILSPITELFRLDIIDYRFIKENFSEELLSQYYIIIDGEEKVYGDKVVYAFGSSKVHAYNTVTVNAYNNTEVFLHQNSKGYINEYCIGNAYDNSTLVCYDNSVGRASQTSNMILEDEAYGESSDNTTIRTYGDSLLYARGNSDVYGAGSSTVHLYDTSNGNFNEHARGFAHDRSTVSYKAESTGCMDGESDGEAKDYSSINMLENSKCNASGYARVTVAGNCSIKGYEYSHIIIHNAAYAQVSDFAYMEDLSDTHTNVNNRAIIQWVNGKQLFLGKELAQS